MTQLSWGSISRAWVEYSGRHRKSVIVEFPEDEITIRMRGFTVSAFTEAIYLNLTPNIHAVITTPEGENKIVRGGYNELQSGHYQIQYVDGHDRSANLPAISETTLDGAKISFTVYIRYRVTNPLILLEIHQPLPTLFSVIESDVKEYIRTHNHDDIIDVHYEVANNHLAHFISQGYNRHAVISKAVTLIDISIKDRQGDASLIELRKTVQVQHRQSQTDKEHLAQKQAMQRDETEQEAFIKQENAKSEAKLQEIMARVRRKENELNDQRQVYERKHEIYRGVIEIFLHMQTTTGYPRNPGDLKAIETVMASLNEDQAMLAGHDDAPDPAGSTYPTGSLDGRGRAGIGTIADVDINAPDGTTALRDGSQDSTLMPPSGKKFDNMLAGTLLNLLNRGNLDSPGPDGTTALRARTGTIAENIGENKPSV